LASFSAKYLKSTTNLVSADDGPMSPYLAQFGPRTPENLREASPLRP